MSRNAAIAWAIIGGAIIAVMTTRNIVKDEIVDSSSNQNVQAFLAMIRQFEAAGEYNILYGGGHFDSYEAHPHVKVPFHNPLRSEAGINDFSTAAGAYQINWPTWLTIQAAAFLPDFSPQSQDEAAIWLLKTRGALSLILAGDFTGALQAASGTWASLPGSKAQQNPQQFNTALNVYRQNGGIA